MCISVVSSHELYYRVTEINVSESYHYVCVSGPVFAENVMYIAFIFREILISNYPSRATLVFQGNAYLSKPQLETGITSLTVDTSTGLVGTIIKQNYSRFTHKRKGNNSAIVRLKDPTS